MLKSTYLLVGQQRWVVSSWSSEVSYHGSNRQLQNNHKVHWTIVHYNAFSPKQAAPKWTHFQIKKLQKTSKRDPRFYSSILPCTYMIKELLWLTLNSWNLHYGMDTHHVCFWYIWTFHCIDLYNEDTSLLDSSLSLYISTATIWTTRLKRPLSETS